MITMVSTLNIDEKIRRRLISISPNLVEIIEETKLIEDWRVSGDIFIDREEFEALKLVFEGDEK